MREVKSLYCLIAVCLISACNLPEERTYQETTSDLSPGHLSDFVTTCRQSPSNQISQNSLSQFGTRANHPRRRSLFAPMGGGTRGPLRQMVVSARIGSNSWTESNSRHAYNQVMTRHPDLIDGIPGKGNPFANVCDNFFTFPRAYRGTIVSRLLLSLTRAEGDFDEDGRGDESASNEIAMGPMQISRNSNVFGCNWGSWSRFVRAVKDIDNSSDCALVMMSYKYQMENLPVANSVRYGTHWSVLRPQTDTKWHGRHVASPFDHRLLPTFRKIVPECRQRGFPDPNARGYKAPPAHLRYGNLI